VLHFTPRPRGRPWSIERQAGGRYLCCPIEGDPAHALNRAWSVLTADAETAAVTHVVAFGGSRPIVAAPVLAAWLGVPLVTLIRGNDFDAAVFSVRRRPVLDDALARSAIVCAVSRDKVAKIAALHPAVDVRWIPNGIDASDWTLIPSDLERARSWRSANVEPDALVLGLFGQLKAKKGGVLLLEALRRSGVSDAFHLILAGWLEPEMESWLAENSGPLHISTLPFLDRYELLPWYAACDWIAIPSFYDGLPNVLVEAAALGIPLIASRTGGMADVLKDGRTALLFDPGDEAGCSLALRRAASLDDPQHRAMGAACRALAEDELNGETEISRYVDVLTESRAASDPIPLVPRAARA
jgi:glycosyltransferase involved in cell wall biosynthesis